MTGCAGFIGYHVTSNLLTKGCDVLGIDDLNNYYSSKLKRLRLELLINSRSKSSFIFCETDISAFEYLGEVFERYKPDIVIHLAAQAGVRWSITNPEAYTRSNLVGFMNILECIRRFPVRHFLYASSSSVYGMNSKIPFSVDDATDYPVSLYAATKKSNEILAYSYSHLYRIPMTGLRFFTVYGPFGRPDMAYYSFTNSIMNDQEIEVFNEGKMERDFTYIDDVVSAIECILENAPEPNINENTNSSAPFKIYNIGNSQPISLIRFITSIESACGKSAVIKYLPMQEGDVPKTFADVSLLEKDFGFRISTSIEDGIYKFVSWFREEKGEQFLR